MPTEMPKALLPAYRGIPSLLPYWDQAQVLKLQVPIQGLGCSKYKMQLQIVQMQLQIKPTACRQRLRRLRFHLQQCHKPLIRVGIIISSQGCLQMCCGLQRFCWLLCSCTQCSSCQSKPGRWEKVQNYLPQTKPLSPAPVPRKKSFSLGKGVTQQALSCSPLCTMLESCFKHLSMDIFAFPPQPLPHCTGSLGG